MAECAPPTFAAGPTLQQQIPALPHPADSLGALGAELVVERKDNRRQGNNRLGQTEVAHTQETDKGTGNKVRHKGCSSRPGGCGGEDTSILTGGEGRKQIDRQEGVGSDRKVLAATNKKARGRQDYVSE